MVSICFSRPATLAPARSGLSVPSLLLYTVLGGRPRGERGLDRDIRGRDRDLRVLGDRDVLSSPLPLWLLPLLWPFSRPLAQT